MDLLQKKSDKRISSDFAFKAAMGRKTGNEEPWIAKEILLLFY